MEYRVSKINKVIKNYDDALYAKKESGVIKIFRKAYNWLSFNFNGDILTYAAPSPHLIFCLTDNWTIHGTPVDWGLEPIANRLKAMDLWNNPDFAERMIKSYEKSKESDRRDVSNSMESFLYDFRKQFAKAFNGINTSTLDKIDRRRMKEK